MIRARGVEFMVEWWVTHTQLSSSRPAFASHAKPNVTDVFLNLNQSGVVHEAHV